MSACSVLFKIILLLKDIEVVSNILLLQTIQMEFPMHAFCVHI